MSEFDTSKSNSNEQTHTAWSTSKFFKNERLWNVEHELSTILDTNRWMKISVFDFDFLTSFDSKFLTSTHKMFPCPLPCISKVQNEWQKNRLHFYVYWKKHFLTTKSAQKVYCFLRWLSKKMKEKKELLRMEVSGSRWSVRTEMLNHLDTNTFYVKFTEVNFYFWNGWRILRMQFYASCKFKYFYIKIVLMEIFSSILPV